MPGAGAQVGTMFAQEGDRQNGLIFHNGRYWTPASYEKQLADEARQKQEADTIARLQATSAKQPTTTGGVINYGPTATSGVSGGSTPSGGGGSSSSSAAAPPANPIPLSQIAAQYDSSLGSPIPPPPVYHAPSPEGVADSSAADSLAFARAKDKVGQTTRASMDALRNEFSARGMLGSNLEGSKIAGVIGQGEENLANTITTQAGNQATRNQAVADRNYAGELSGANTEYSGALSARSQDLGAAENRRQSILALARMAPGGLLY